MRLRVLAAVLILLSTGWVTTPAGGVAAEADWEKETKAERDARMEWWREARFGMFIHWGLYAIPAGTWQGQRIEGIGEWIMDRANVPVDEYEELAKQFDPVKFDASQWARIAKDAGMKYLVITSKHHDGFCLFGTKATPYNVVDASPYGRDLLKPLAEQCRKQGIKFCVYYSIMDWHHPAQYRGSEKRYNPTKVHPERKQQYIDFMKQQLSELLQICDPEVLWFDGEWPKWFTPDDGWELYGYLRELKPQLIINNRVGTGRRGMEGLDAGDQKYAGDFGTPEQQIPATGLPGVDWESCMTMNRTWGFKSYDDDWKSSETLIRNLIDIASKGGNYLLNVGPTAEGLIPLSVERLARIGQWMKVNGESIYGTQASPFEKTPWGRCTQKPLSGNKTRLYLHVFERPEGGKLSLPANAATTASAFLLDGGRKLEVTLSRDKLEISIPGDLPDPIATVVVLDVQRD